MLTTAKWSVEKRTLGSDKAQNPRKHTDLEGPTPLLNQAYLDGTERLACNDESVITTMNELLRRIIALHVGDGDKPNIEATQPSKKVESGSSDIEGHAGTCGRHLL